MKFALLAASALAFSTVPAFAQDAATPPPADTMTQPQDTTQTPAQEQMTPPTDQAAPPATDPAMQAQPAPTDPAMQAQPAPAPDAAMPAQGMGQPTTGQMTQGGYAPSAPPMAGAAQPGAQVVFRPSTPVAQAFPPPAPKESYPVCSRSVQDACRNPGSR